MVRFSKKKTKGTEMTRDLNRLPLFTWGRGRLSPKKRVPSSKRSIKTEPSVMFLATYTAQFYWGGPFPFHLSIKI